MTSAKCRKQCGLRAGIFLSPKNMNKPRKMMTFPIGSRNPQAEQASFPPPGSASFTSVQQQSNLSLVREHVLKGVYSGIHRPEGNLHDSREHHTPIGSVSARVAELFFVLRVSLPCPACFFRDRRTRRYSLIKHFRHTVSTCRA